MKRLLASLAGIGILSSGLVLAAPTPAKASWGDCNSNYMCLWGGTNWNGGPWWEKRSTGSYSTGYWDNDETSSVANRSSTSSLMVFAREDQKTDEGVACVPRNYSDRDIHRYGWGDRISSMRISAGACPENGVDYLGSRKLS